MDKYEIYKRVLPSVGPIILRNILLLVNAIILLVVILLFVFGNTQSAIFIGIVLFLNTSIAIVQDIRARILLEKLQMLTALRVVRLNDDNTESLVLAEKIKKGDLIKLKLGDQAPCEGILTLTENLEISEALITGESDSFSKRENEKIIAGAIITSGSGVMKAEGIFRESRLFMISEDVKKYAASPSSIQKGIDIVIKYSGYSFLLVLLFVVIRGILIGASNVEMVMNAGALASIIIPQGLVVVVTLLFAVGAASYSKRDVLFQEINATEKLGRVKNLCIDKTGTLTDNILVVEEMHIYKDISEINTHSLTYESIIGLNDSSQTILAVKNYLEEHNKKDGKRREIVSTFPFSSWRRYGVVEIKEGEMSQAIFIGAPDVFIPRISNKEEKKYLEDIVEENSQKGKRVLCVVRANKVEIKKDPKELDFSIISVFVFHNTLRQGIEKAIKFFQDRGIRIRVLSGDNWNTVEAVAQSVGITGAENVITGDQIEKWSDSDFEKYAHEYTVFAQILPEHKVKLVEMFKKDGFTAMVGDGVNDALAMEKSDLGIAMFDGVPVTRQLAGVILMTNSFSDLPGAIELADNFIRSLEISSGIYINQSVIGLFFFVLISILGYSFSLTPLNVTFINYFAVGLPTILISYWALRPSGKTLPTNDKSFLSRVMPLVFICSAIEAIGIATVAFFSPEYLKIATSNTLVGFSFILFGFIFLIFAINIYSNLLTKKEKFELFLLGIAEVVLFFIVLQIPIVIKFFDITLPFPSFNFFALTLFIILVCTFLQYFIVKKYFLKKK